MKITSGADWVEIATAAIVFQKNSSNPLRLAYSNGTPAVDVGSFGVRHTNPEFWPAVTGKTLWAKAEKGDVLIAFENVAV